MNTEKLLRAYWVFNKALGDSLTRLAATEWAAAAVVAWTLLCILIGAWISA